MAKYSKGKAEMLSATSPNSLREDTVSGVDAGLNSKKKKKPFFGRSSTKSSKMAEAFKKK